MRWPAPRGVYRVRTFSVVIDEAQAAPVQLFSPHNMRPGFRARRTYAHIPQGARVQFLSRYTWQRDEVVTYRDGFDAATATLYEVLDLPAALSRDQAYRHGAYYLAQATQRADTYEIPADVEAIVCEPGDRIRVQHDAVPAGLITGRVTQIEGSASIVLDEQVDMAHGRFYGLRARLSDGSQITAEITTVTGGTHRLMPAGGVPVGLAVGDLVAVGEMGQETLDLIVKSIRPEDDLAATPDCVPAADILHDPITLPPYDDGDPLPGDGGDMLVIPPPDLQPVTTLIDVSGEPAWRIDVSWLPWDDAALSHYRAQITHPDGRIEQLALDPGQAALTVEPALAGAYEIAAWVVTADGREGPPGRIDVVCGPLPCLGLGVSAATDHVHVRVQAPRYVLTEALILMAGDSDDPAHASVRQVDAVRIDTVGGEIGAEPGRRVELTHSGAGVVQYYWVWARQRLGGRSSALVDGPWVAPISAVPTGGEIGAPTLLTAHGGVRAVDVTCVLPESPAIMRVVLYGSATGLWADATIVDQAMVGPDLTVSLRQAGLGDEETHYYWVRAVLVGGAMDGPLVGSVSATTVVPLPVGTPGEVSGLTAIGGVEHVRIACTAPTTPDLIELVLYRSLTADIAQAIQADATTAGAGQEVVLIDPSVPPDQRRWYWVRGRSLSGSNGPLTGPVNAVASQPIPGGTPGACTDLHGVGGYGHNRIAVTAPSAPELVVIELLSAATAEFLDPVQIDSGVTRAHTTVTIEDIDLGWGQTRFYRCRARSLDGRAGPWTDPPIPVMALAEPVMEVPPPTQDLSGLPGACTQVAAWPLSPLAMAVRCHAPVGTPPAMAVRLWAADTTPPDPTAPQAGIVWHTDIRDATGISNHVAQSLALTADEVLVGGTAGRVVALRQSDGSLAWHEVLTGWSIGHIRVDPGGSMIFVSQGGSRVASYAPARTPRWDIDVNRGRIYDIDIDAGGNVYTANQDGSVSKINLIGDVEWSVPMGWVSLPGAGSAVLGVAASPDGNIYCCGWGPDYAALTSSGQILWNRSLGSVFWGGINPARGGGAWLYSRNYPAKQTGTWPVSGSGTLGAQIPTGVTGANQPLGLVEDSQGRALIARTPPGILRWTGTELENFWDIDFNDGRNIQTTSMVISHLDEVYSAGTLTVTKYGPPVGSPPSPEGFALRDSCWANAGDPVILTDPDLAPETIRWYRCQAVSVEGEEGPLSDPAIHATTPEA